MTGWMLQFPFIGKDAAEAMLTCFLHSLWTGSLAAGAAAVVLHIPGKHSALRYWLLVIILALFAGINAGIFIDHIKNLSGSVQPVLQNALVITGVYDGSGVQGSEKISIGAEIIPFLQNNSPWFILTWFIVIIYKSVRLLAEYSWLMRLKKQSFAAVEPEWINKLKVLAQNTGIYRRIQLRWSAGPAVPMVIGIMKPVIILPAAILNALSPAAVEAILLHELSHIRRQDFFVNLIQECLEILFFFNPAVIWISSRIRKERENCCDDRAIAISRDKHAYVNALVAFQEYHIRQSGLLTGFPGSGNHLFHRVNRIITNQNKSMNIMEKFILTSLILLGCAAIAAFTGLSPEKSEHKTNALHVYTLPSGSNMQGRENVQKVTFQAADTLPPKINITSSPMVEYQTTIEGKTYTIVEKNGKVYTMTINGKKISTKNFHKYQSVTDRIHEEMSHENESNKDRLPEQEFEEQVEREIYLKSLKEDLVRINRELEWNQQLNMERVNKIQGENLRKLKEEQSVDRQIHEKEMFNYQHELQDHMRQLKKLEKQQYELMLLQQKAQLMQNKILHDSSLQKEHLLMQELHHAEQVKFEKIVKFLIDEGVVKDTDKISFTISADSFIINGEKQPTELHKKVIEKFFSNADRSFKFSYHHNEQP